MITNAASHKPAQFDPSQYTVEGYMDNKPPEFPFHALMIPSKTRFDELVAAHRVRVDAWRADMNRLFPNGGHKCHHCGNGSVRYVASVRHTATGELICMGDICVNRLDLPGQDAFRAKHIRSKAQNDAACAARIAKIEKVLTDNPALAEAITALNSGAPEHTKNHFGRDVAAKLVQYGDLSEKQIAAVVNSVARDREFAAKKAEAVKDIAPIVEGRYEVEGEVVTLKRQDSFYGVTLKMLVKRADGAKFWVTVPAALDGVEKGSTVKVTAQWERSKDDHSFAFGKRPKGSIVEAPVPALEGAVA